MTSCLYCWGSVSCCPFKSWPLLGFGLTLQNIKADAAQLVHVRMVYLREEADFRGRHWIIVGQEEFQLKNAAYSFLVSIQIRQARRRAQIIPSYGDCEGP